MTAQHNPIKAAAEQLSGMEDVWKVLHTMVRHAERKASEAETELSALLKVRAVVGNVIDDQRANLERLRAEQDRAAKGFSFGGGEQKDGAT